MDNIEQRAIILRSSLEHTGTDKNWPTRRPFPFCFIIQRDEDESELEQVSQKHVRSRRDLEQAVAEVSRLRAQLVEVGKRSEAKEKALGAKLAEVRQERDREHRWVGREDNKEEITAERPICGNKFETEKNSSFQ